MAEPPPSSTPPEDRPEPITSTHFARSVLTLRFPGGVTLRPMATCLEVILGQTRSPAWLSMFLNDAGERAGQVLAEADWSAVPPFIGTRDEEFFDDRRVRGLAAYIRKQQPQLFTFHEWLAVGLVPWRRRAREHFGDAEVTELFERAVARSWRIQPAITNGRHCLHNAADRAEAEVASLCQNDPRAACLALELTALLEEVVRTSSASERLNSLSNHFLVTKRGFPERLNSQHFFNLVMLWHNLRRFERGKRKGKSPFEILGVRVFDPDGNETDDWMAALGYPEEACPAAAAA